MELNPGYQVTNKKESAPKLEIYEKEKRSIEEEHKKVEA